MCIEQFKKIQEKLVSWCKKIYQKGITLVILNYFAIFANE